MEFTYKTKGVCSQLIKIDVSDEGTVNSVSFVGGCNGNLKGISELVKGMKVEEVVERLQDIKCGFKPTSCPAQLAEALKLYNKGEENV